MPEAVTERINNAVRNMFGVYRNEVWGHLIYKPAERAKWKIPKGMKTLEEFLKWHESIGEEQKKEHNPIVLEVFCIISTTKELSKSGFTHIVRLLQSEMIDNEYYQPALARLMEWGYDSIRMSAPVPLECGKRLSRDGDDFTEEDTTEWIRERLEIEYVE